MENRRICLLLFYFFWPLALFYLLFKKYGSEIEKSHAVQACVAGALGSAVSFMPNFGMALSAIVFLAMLFAGAKAYLHGQDIFIFQQIAKAKTKPKL